jgi:hypothetical protein
MPNNTVASNDAHPWRWVSLGLAGYTVYKFASGKKVEPIALVTSSLAILAFLRDL